MKKVNTREVVEETWESPKGKFAGASKGLSLALGREEDSPDLRKRHPFDVEVTRIPPGKANCPFHSHSAQWEFYHVISGMGHVRHDGGRSVIEAGDVFIFGPGEAHQLINDSSEDLVLYVVADNPIGESCYYPDSKKWSVRSPFKRIIRSEQKDYYLDEE